MLGRYIPILLLTGCMHIDNPLRIGGDTTPPRPGCPVEETDIAGSPEQVDLILRKLDLGCRRHYGPTSCLRKAVQKGEQSYWAYCSHRKGS